MVAGVYEGLNCPLYSSPANSTRVVDLALQETGQPGNTDAKYIVRLKPKLLVAASGTSASHGLLHRPFSPQLAGTLPNLLAPKSRPLASEPGELRWDDDLGIQMIFALSPQGKGRVERTAGTFQDRLITELGLAGATTIEQAKAVLEQFLPRYNRRF